MTAQVLRLAALEWYKGRVTAGIVLSRQLGGGLYQPPRVGQLLLWRERARFPSR